MKFILLVFLLLILLSYIECQCSGNGYAWNLASNTIDVSCPTGYKIDQSPFEYIYAVGSPPDGMILTS